jgi:RND superfamily putative drug exporter
MLAFPLLFLLSFVFFRSLVAALLPVMIGLLAIVGTFLILRVASEFGSISIFALNLTTGLGLGLAIDYSLFIVSRYREEIAKDGPGLAAMRRVLATAGRTVFFSSLTVAAALASLLVFPQRFLYSMGLGGSLVVLLAALISLTVLPAVLTLLGTRVNSLAPRSLQRRAEADTRPDEQGFWYRLSRFVLRRPLPIATPLSALFLIVLGLPFLGIKFNTVDPTVLPESASARPGLRHGQHRVPALPRDPDLGRRRRRRAEGGHGDGGADRPKSTGSPKCCPRRQLRGDRHGAAGGLRQPPSSPTAATRR